MICMLLNYSMKPGISIDKYYRDRAILAGRTASSAGRWSVKWAVSQLLWHDHCMRGTDKSMWHVYILKHHDAQLNKERI